MNDLILNGQEGSNSDELERFLARIEARDHDVRAWATLNAEGARSAIARLDARTEGSPVRGMTVGLKDIIETADLPTGYGAAAWKGHRPAADAVAVERLRAAGAIILGKTTTTEFALYDPSVTMNPYHADRTPGGSSSGSAAAVADGQVRVALGTQTAGSVTRPGSFCGVFTLKPTYHRWPYSGVLPVSLTFDTLGAFARNLDDLGRLDSVLASPDGMNRGLPALSALRVGRLCASWFKRAEPEANQMLDRVIESLRPHVATVTDVDLGPLADELDVAHARIQGYEARLTLSAMIARDPESISPALRAALGEAARLSTDEVQAARVVLRQARALAADLFSRFDVLVLLAAPGEAPLRHTTGDPVFSRFASTAGLPAVGVPAGRGSTGLPLGVQFIGPPASDRALLTTVAQLANQFADIPALVPAKVLK